MPLRIASITCRPVSHRLRQDRLVVSAAGKHDRSDFVEVTVTDPDGRRGFGEAATVALWSAETAATALAIINELFIPRLVGITIDHPRQALAIIDSTTVGNSFTKSAVDCAIWDLWAKAQGKRVVDLIADRTPVEAIPTRASVGCYPVEQTVRIAQAFWDAGVRTIKFKISAPGFDDVARLKAVRDALGDKPIFTVDANGGYPDEDSAVRALEKLIPFKLSLIEQPTPRERISLLGKIRRRTAPVPMMADESVFNQQHLNEAIDLDTFDILSVYPGKNGGFTHTLDMVRTAQRAGKVCAIGSNLETDLGQAAMATVASGLSAFPLDRLACDLPGVLFYESSSTNPSLRFANGAVHLPPVPATGFGVEPRP